MVLGKLPRITDENVLVGYDTADDAGVYKLSEELALVQTVDFFTPIVDDPFTYGQIAAVNSLSDIYAMGGKPVSALSIVAFPANGEPEVLAEIVRGGLSKLTEAGCALLGGHSITDEEIKFGYAVTGTIHPQRVLANAGARDGDRLVLTKKIGTGIVSTALKKGFARAGDVEASVGSMLTLNRRACEVMLRYPVHGCTDITGFGLLGHAREMALASGVTLEISSGEIEFLPGAIDYSAQGAIPGGLKNNREFVSCAVKFRQALPEEIENLLYDPQTAGGLLISVAAAGADELAAEIRETGETARVIGSVRARDKTPVVVA